MYRRAYVHYTHLVYPHGGSTDLDVHCKLNHYKYLFRHKNLIIRAVSTHRLNV